MQFGIWAGNDWWLDYSSTSGAIDGVSNWEGYSDVFRSGIAQVHKRFVGRTGSNLNDIGEKSVDVKTWLFSASEIFGVDDTSSGIVDDGPRYKLFVDLDPKYDAPNPYLVREIPGTSAEWFLRSLYPKYSGGMYWAITNNGSTRALQGHFSALIIVGFCY